VDPSQLSFDIGQVTMNACLAHDIGNPPFGHAGEKAIDSFFESSMPSHFLQGLSENERNDLIFEANAQGFRWLTRLQDFRGEGGLRLTCATLAAFTKYPITSIGTAKEYVGFKKHGYFGEDVESFTGVASEDLVRGAELSYCLARRYLQPKRRYDLFARLYDFIVLLSSAPWNSSLHALGYSFPSLGS
jgi:dGTP triphosphohydrolase